MEQVAAFMLLVGCTPDAASCTEIPVPTPIYRSVEACEAAMPLAIRLSSTFDPKILGACTKMDAAEPSASIEWAVNRAGVLTVELSSEPNLLASR